MSFNVLVGAELKDEDLYQAYRDKMYPLLKSFGGDFKYDFQAKATAMSQNGTNFNRVFVISFPDEKSRDSFFSDAEYLAIREDYLNPSVVEITPLSSWTD